MEWKTNFVAVASMMDYHITINRAAARERLSTSPYQSPVSLKKSSALDSQLIASQ